LKDFIINSDYIMLRVTLQVSEVWFDRRNYSGAKRQRHTL